MAYMIQITEEKKEKLSEMCEKMLHYGGKMMQCLESLDDDREMGMRDEEDYYGHRYGMRQGVKGTGRYSRY